MKARKIPALSVALTLTLALASAAAGESAAVPHFEVGGKTVEARQGEKTIWKMEIGFEVGGVIADPQTWIVYSKDQSTTAMVHAASGKLVYKRTARGNHIEGIRKKAAEEVEAYLKSLDAPKPGPDVDARVAELIKGLGAANFSAREKASKGLVAIGKPALGQLKEAMKNPDPEVASRAETVAEEIEGGEILERLRGYSFYARIVVDQAQQKAEKEAGTAAGKLAAAGKSGGAGDAAALKTAADAARNRAAALADLQRKLGAGGGVGAALPQLFGGPIRIIE